jgi:beta-galactosidase
MRFGVCWYPEQWPETRWGEDAAQMAELGQEPVPIGEFAWSRFEPGRGTFDWGWLDRAIEALADAGLRPRACGEGAGSVLHGPDDRGTVRLRVTNDRQHPLRKLSEP